MEEKTKSIIMPIIAILLGIIVGGCTQVKADGLEDFMGSLNIYVNNNLDYAYTSPELQYPINIDNASYTGTTSTQVNNVIDGFLRENVYIKIRLCSIGESDNVLPVSVSSQGVYGKPVLVKVYNTSTICNYDLPGSGVVTGTEREIIIQVKNGNGMYNYVDLDNGRYQHQIYIQLNMIATSWGSVAKIRYVWSDNMKVPNDAIQTNEETLKEIQNILNGGKFEKPNKDTALEDIEEDESLLQDILGIPNYNELNIDINENATNVIWDLIIRVLNQNTAILTMVITILSISILKLIMNR